MKVKREKKITTMDERESDCEDDEREKIKNSEEIKLKEIDEIKIIVKIYQREINSKND